MNRLGLILLCSGVLCAAAWAGDTYDVSGRVLDAQTGKGIPRARVTAEIIIAAALPPGAGFFKELPYTSLVGLTDEEGAFAFTSLPQGSASFWVEKPGYLGGRNRKETSLKAVDARAATIQFSMIRQAVIEGKIVDENSRGVASQVSLWHVNPQTQAIETVNPSAVGASPSDEFRFYGLEAGTYFVQVTSNYGPASTTYPSVLYPHAGDLASAKAIRLEPGQQEHLEFQLKQVSAYRIRGRFSGGNANGAQNISTPQASTRMFALNLHLPGLPSGNGLGEISIDANAQTFEITRVAPGTYILEVTKWPPDGKQAKGTRTITVEDRDVEGIVIDLAPVDGPSLR